MTETGEGRGADADDREVGPTTVRAVERGPGVPARRHSASDGVEAEHGWNAPDPLGERPGAGPEVTVRRRAAEAAARAAEARATAAAADAKAAIALAARAAAAADAAAQAAEQADAAVRVAAAAEAGSPFPSAPFPAAGLPGDAYPGDGFAPDRSPGDDHPAGGSSRHGFPAEDLGDPLADTATMHRAVVPAPRGSGRHGDHAADAAGFEGGRAARRRAAAAETTVFDAVPADGYADDEDVTGLMAAQPGGEHRDGEHTAADHAAVDLDGAAVADEPVTELVDSTAVVPAGRRARRAAAAQAAEAARDGDPDGHEPDADGRADAGPTRRADRRSAARRGLFGRRRTAVLAAAGGLLALTGVVVATSGGGGADPAPAAVVESVAPAVPVLPDAATAPEESAVGSPGSGDPDSERGAAFLRELRAAGVPTSRSGAEEVEAADLVCGGLDDSISEAEIADALPASLPAVSLDRGADLVEVAKENYCR